MWLVLCLFLYLQKIQGHQYQSREMFEHDIQLIHDNSVKYNGKDHSYTATAKKMLDTCLVLIQEVSYNYSIETHCEITLESVPGTNQYSAMRVKFLGQGNNQEPLIEFELKTD